MKLGGCLSPNLQRIIHTHGYGLGTHSVPNNKQGNYLSNLLGSNLCELKRLRRSSLTFFSQRLSSWRYPSPIFYYAILHCYNSWQQTTVDTSCRYYQSWYSKRSIIWTTLVTTKCILLSAHQKNDSSCCIERPTPIVKAMRYLTHIYAIPLNDYILLKYLIVFIYLPWSRYSRIDDIRYLTHLSIICGGRRTTLHGRILA